MPRRLIRFLWRNRNSIHTNDLSVRGDPLAHVGAGFVVTTAIAIIRSPTATVRIAVLHGRVLAGGHLEAFPTAREGPLELDVGRIGGHPAENRHGFVQGGSDQSDVRWGAHGSICNGGIRPEFNYYAGQVTLFSIGGSLRQTMRKYSRPSSQ